MTADRRKSPWPSLVWGSALLTAGLIFWFDRLGRIEAVEYFRWWPVVLIATGLAEIPARRWGSALVWLIIGGFFLLPKFGLALQPWRLLAFWHLFISAAGIALIAQALRRPSKQNRGDTFRSVAVMGADTRTVRSPNFAGGEAVVVMAGSLIDIAPARAPLTEVVLDVLAFWGGIEIQVPPGWQVVNEVALLLGGFDNKTAAATPNAPRVVIRGAAIMGGIEVRNPAEARRL
jgi:hypothetical protein